MTNVRVVDDPAQFAADRLSAVAAAGGSIVLAGGSTPRRAYELASGADWSGATLWYGDERCVPPDDPRSNHLMVAEALLSRLVVPPAAVHRVRGELDPSAAADDYEALLTGAKRFDLVLLGIGSDAHTASLFPGKPAVDESDRLAVAVPEVGLEPFVPRVTLTIPALARAREVIFLAVGVDKASPVRRSFGREAAEDTPAGLVARAADTAGADVSVVVDRDAAAGL
ncbi:MAG: 6-phosphogluconolactonase [Solirubrobacterales bacterium]